MHSAAKYYVMRIRCFSIIGGARVNRGCVINVENEAYFL